MRCRGALAQMIEQYIHHLPVVDDAEKVVGMLSMRHLMRAQIDGLKAEVNAQLTCLRSPSIHRALPQYRWLAWTPGVRHRRRESTPHGGDPAKS